MRASEWQYLCAVHDPPKSCCAIDYCCHTLDWAASILTSQKHFPSRLTLGGNADSSGGGASQQGGAVRQLTNIFRRVYRIFAHAWFQHRHVFWQVEAQDGLYVFFKTVCDFYALIPEDNYTIPPEAEGISTENEKIPTEELAPGSRKKSLAILTRTQDEQAPASAGGVEDTTDQETPSTSTANTTISTGATTRRHKHTPSTGSFVTTIVEGDEEDKEQERGGGGEPELGTTSEDLPITKDLPSNDGAADEGKGTEEEQELEADKGAPKEKDQDAEGNSREQEVPMSTAVTQRANDEEESEKSVAEQSQSKEISKEEDGKKDKEDQQVSVTEADDHEQREVATVQESSGISTSEGAVAGDAKEDVPINLDT